MTNDTHLRRTIACPCAACGAQPLHPCATPEGRKLGIFCLIPEGQTPIQDWVSLGFHATALYEKSKAPIAMRLPCEKCGTLHIDVGKFRTHPHHTHTCQNKQCGLTWRPAKEHTVGVRFIPGFEDQEPTERLNSIHGWTEGLGPILPYSTTESRPAFWAEDRSTNSYRITAQVVSVREGDLDQRERPAAPHHRAPGLGKGLPTGPRRRGQGGI